MFKAMGLMKRKAGMSMDDFTRHFETRHVKLAEPYYRDAAVRYLRRYIQPMVNPLSGDTPEPEFDLLVEIWFPDQERWESAMSALARPEIAGALREDASRCLDGSKMLFFTVVEQESDFSGA